jgi:hypothetical protein
MKRIVLGTVLAAVVGCGDGRPVVEERQGAVEAVYGTSIANPQIYNVDPPPPLAMPAGTEYLRNWIGGWIDHQPATGDQTFRTMPNEGWPTRLSMLLYFSPPGSMSPGSMSQPTTWGSFNFPLVDSTGRRQVMICSWDKRFAWAGGLQNKVCNQIPLPTTGLGANGKWVGAKTFYVADQSQVHYVTNPGDPSVHINDGIFQVSTLWMDKYVRCEVCSGANMTGSCHWFGYNCPDQGPGGTCSAVPGEKANQDDIRQWTGDAVSQYSTLAYKCEYADNTLGTHGVPAPGTYVTPQW